MLHRTLIIGLTGGIGMGKSTLASQLAAMGAKICNADHIVHKLLSKGGAGVEPVGKAFPGVVSGGAVNRKALGEIVFADGQKRRELEAILHPLVVAQENAFMMKEGRLGARLLVLDIPLLFETAADERCDVVLVASAPAFLQRSRVLKRPGMSEQKFRRIVASQMPERHKRFLADAVVATGLGKAHSYRQMKKILEQLCGK